LRRLIAMLLFGTVLVLLAGCGPREPSGGASQLKGRITASGSTALLPLVKTAAEEFQRLHPGVTVEVTGGGSFVGLKQVAEGTVHIGMSDVPAPADDPLYRGLKPHVVAGAPVVFIVHPGVPVDSLTREQLAGILTGKFTNWKQVGGSDQPITVVGRSKASGTLAAVKEIVLRGQEQTTTAVVFNSTGEVKKNVALTPGSIGYIDAAYVDASVKVLRYEGVAYTPENAATGKYPLVVREYLYTKGEPDPVVKAFIDYILAPEFQQKVGNLGFLAVSQMPGS